MKVKNVGSLDANVLLRLLLNDIPTQHDAAKKLLTSTNQHFVVADITVMEIVLVLTSYYEFSRDQVADAVKSLISIVQINCNRVLLVPAIEMYVAHPALSFEDCCLAEYARLNNALPLYTFDKKLANQHECAKLLR